MAVPAHTEPLRSLNRHAVYRALAASGDLTRAELALATQLSLPTVSSILGELADLGVVADAGTENGTGGRPAQRVRFAPEARCVLAVDLSGRRALACRIDLRGDVVSMLEGPILAPGVTGELVDWLAPLARPSGERPVSRLALAVPGVVDPVDGHVDFAPALGWHDHAVAEAFEAALGIGVVLENDVNALALAELHYGAGAAHRHVLYVAIGSGVGAGLVIDGQLYRGAHAAAGELGYSLPLTPRPARRAAPAAARPGRGAEPGPLERELLETARGCLDDAGRLDLARPGAACAFARFAETLGPLLHNLACVLDPELLVLAWSADPDGVLAARLQGSWNGPWPLPIASGTLAPQGAARGVARLALDRVEADICRGRAAPAARPAPHGSAPEGREPNERAAPDAPDAPRRSTHA